jgi:hypothetical protein
MALNKCCFNCDFYYEDTGPGRNITGEECRFNPPRIYPELTLQYIKEHKVYGPIYDLMAVGIFPSISLPEDCWCGSYKQNPNIKE